MTDANATPDTLDSGPKQINVPPYPGTTRIENGQAFDVAGKVLGGVDDSGKPTGKAAPTPPAQTFDYGFGKQAKPATPAASGFDYGFGKHNDNPTKGTRFEGAEKIGNYFLAKPMEGEENAGVAHSIHGLLSFPNALYHAFSDPATPQEKVEIEQKMNQMRAGQGMPAASTLPAVPGQVIGAVTNTYDKTPKPPTRTQLALHRLIDAPADELDAKANRELETSRELWDKRHEWSGLIPTGTGISIPMNQAMALSGSLSGAADKVLSRIPMLGPLVNGISEKFEKGDISGGMTDLAGLKLMEAVHQEATGEPAVPSKMWHDKGNELGRAAGKLLSKASEVSDKANAAKEDFQRVVPPTKAAPYDANDYEIVRRGAEEQHKADKLSGGQGITDVESARDAVEDSRQAIENKRGGAVKANADRPITTNVFEDVANALFDKDQNVPGWRDRGMKVLEDYDFKDMTNGEADAVRKELVAKNRLKVQKPGDAASLRESDPVYAANEAVINSLRNGIYGSLQEAGVPEAYDWARDEAAHIRVRNAIDRQLYNGEKTLRGSGDASTARKIAAQSARGLSTVTGGGVGAAVGGLPGAIVGSAAGSVLGEGLSRAILPDDLTRNEMMARSFQNETATPGGPTVPESQAPNVPHPEGPAGPDLPPPPQPIAPVMPPPDHALHAALATRVGTTVERSSLNNLMTQFQQYLDSTPTQNLTDADRELLEQVNQSQGARRAKMAEAVQTAVEKNKAAREKWQQEVQKVQEKYAAEQKKSVAEAVTDKEKEQADLLADENIAHSPVMKATEKAMEIKGVEGRTPLQNMEHEHGHILAFAAEKLNPINFISESHPDALEHNAAASVQADVSDAEEGAKGLAQRVVGILGGPAFDEIHHDISINRNPGARADIARAREILRGEGGLKGDDLNKVFDALYDRAKEHVSNPEALALVRANAPLREAGLHENYHMSPGRLAEYVKKLQGVFNGNGETPSTTGVHEGPADGGLPEGEQAGAGGAGEKPNGPAARVSSEEARAADEAGGGKEGKREEQANLSKEDEEAFLTSEYHTPLKQRYNVEVTEGGETRNEAVDAFSHKQAMKAVQKEFPNAQEWSVGERASIPNEGGYSVPNKAPLFTPGSKGGRMPIENTMKHELGHYMVGHNEGFLSDGVLRHTHPDMPKGVNAAVFWDNGQFYDAATRRIKAEKLPGVIRMLMGGVAADEAFSDLPRDKSIQFDPKAGGDGTMALRFLRTAGFDHDTAMSMMHAAVDQAKEHLTKPAVSDIINENAGVRENNLSTQYHYSPERLKAMGDEASRRLGEQNEPNNGRAGTTGDQIRAANVGGREGEAAGTVGERVQTPQVSDRVSTRVPEGKAATENPLEGEPLVVGREALKNTPEKLQQKFADTVRDYPGVKIPAGVKDPGKVMDRFVSHVKDNLKFIYDQVPPEKQAANAKWYESANKLSKDLADQHGISEPQSAATIATQSPQKDWDMNVSLARRIADIHTNHQDTVTTPEMLQKGRDIVKNTGANEDLGKALDNLEGKKFSQLTDPYDRAAWVRLYDEAHNGREFHSIDPGTGENRGLRTNADGSPSKVAWGSLPQIDNALSVLDNGSRENISERLGGMHKVRNFYNNIIDPTNDQDVTIDTHAVAAGLMQPLGGSAPEVLDNFGKAGKHTGTGVKGTYPLYADAYRQAAGELGIKPRELQSVVWEHVREMFPSEWKSPENEKLVKNVWKKYSDGKQSLDKTRQQILKISEEAQKGVNDTREAAQKKALDKQAKLVYAGKESGGAE
jgi:hypothetical protein